MSALSSSSPGTVAPRDGTSGAALADLAPGTWLGKHQLLHRLAVGGMAEIYLARATGIEQFEKLLVVKRMLPQHADDHRFIRMFLDEARLAATFSHPNIAHVYDIGGSDGHYYFTMEYVHGEDLGSVLQASRAAGRAVPLAHALTIVAGVAAGLHAAHDKRGADGAPLGVVHRDVSPSNILVGHDGCVKIADFGIAKVAAQHGRTGTGFLGKARYASPEHVQGQALDRRSDLFSLGIVLFELTCGRRPFDGDTEFAVMQAIVHGDVPRPGELVPGYPAALEQIVLRALRRDRDARFATAQDLQVAVEDFARQHQLGLSSVALSAYLGELFSGKLAAWHDAQRAGRSLTDHVIAEATGGTVDLAAVEAVAPPAPRSATTAVDGAGAPVPPSPGRDAAARGRVWRRGVAVVGVAAALALAIAVAVWRAPRDPSGAAAAAAPSPAADPAGAAAPSPSVRPDATAPGSSLADAAMAAHASASRRGATAPGAAPADPAGRAAPSSIPHGNATAVIAPRSDSSALATPGVAQRPGLAPPTARGPRDDSAAPAGAPPGHLRASDAAAGARSRTHRAAAGAGKSARGESWDPDSALEP
jgi:tRNA A-37 threonylcarbamoyl transferase component Bud32